MFVAADHPTKVRRPEVIEGIFREGQIVTLCGPFSSGKTPILKDWAVAVAGGLDWCGCATTQRPVVIADFESDDGEFYENLSNIATRRVGPTTPLDITLFLRNGDEDDVMVEKVYALLGSPMKERFKWVEEQLAAHPTGVFVIDPVQILFPEVDKNKSQHVTFLFSTFRTLKRKYRGASFIFVYNVRKDSNQKKEPVSLLEYPHDWLQEISGSLDLQNRSDVRLGMEFMKKGERDVVVLNGIRRGETIEPFLLEAVHLPDSGEEPRLGGFTRIAPESIDPETVLTAKMYAAWYEMDETFTVAELAKKSSRGTAYRLIARARRMQIVKEVEPGRFQKVGKVVEE